MKKRRKRVFDENMPVGRLTTIPDFLPPPEKLIFPKRGIKVTIILDEDSLDFFKKKAKKIGAKYQKMIREVVRGYVRHYS